MPDRAGGSSGSSKEAEVHILWMSAGLGCDGDSVAITAATQPSLEDLVLGAIPGLPAVRLHHPLLATENGGDFLAAWHGAWRGELDPFVLVFEGSVPNEEMAGDGYFAAFGNDPDTGDPITTCTWLDRLAPRAWAVTAMGTCAAFGGIHAMAGNPTGAMGLTDYLGSEWRSAAGLPVVNVPGCPAGPDNMTETLLRLLFLLAGRVDTVPLDEVGRPTWLFEGVARDGCTRAGYNENADFATVYDSPQCLAKIGCWGPVVNCNMSRRGWVRGVGGCPTAGGVCIGCTMPGFPDRFMPFLNQPMGGDLAAHLLRPQGAAIRTLRMITNSALSVEPGWRRRPGSETEDRPAGVGGGPGAARG